MKNLVFTILISCIFANIPIQKMTLSIYPEYDHPGVLVMYQMTIAKDVLGGTLEMELPKEAKMALVSVAGGQSNSRAKRVELESRDGSKWVTIKPDSVYSFLEFYYNPFASGAGERNFSYQFNSKGDVDSLYVVVQKKLGALNFNVDLPQLNEFTNRSNLRFYEHLIPNVKAGDSHKIPIRYLNPDGKTTRQILQEHSSGAQSGSTQTVRKLDIPRTIGAIAALMFVILFWVGFIKKQKKMTKHKTVFCTNCGSKIPQEQSFCTNCGRNQNAS